jgi:hypothetical protein
VNKLYNAKKEKRKKHRKKLKNQSLKLLNLNLKKQSNKFCKKPKENICLLPLCDLSKLIFSTLFEKDLK